MRITASDRSSLIRLASELPAGSQERRAILSGLSKVAAKAEEPFQKVEGAPYRGAMDKIRGVTTMRQLKVLSALLDKVFEKKPSAADLRLLKDYGVGQDGLKNLADGSGYMLWVTDSEGTEFDVFNDLDL